MDACRRVVAALLFVLWAAIGVQLPGAESREDNATRSATSRATTCRRREGQAKRDAEAARTPAADGGDDDDGCVPALLTGAPAWILVASSNATSVGLERRWSTHDSIAGRPRGPPTPG